MRNVLENFCVVSENNLTENVLKKLMFFDQHGLKYCPASIEESSQGSMEAV